MSDRDDIINIIDSALTKQPPAPAAPDPLKKEIVQTIDSALAAIPDTPARETERRASSATARIADQALRTTPTGAPRPPQPLPAFSLDGSATTRQPIHDPLAPSAGPTGPSPGGILSGNYASPNQATNTRTLVPPAPENLKIKALLEDVSNKTLQIPVDGIPPHRLRLYKEQEYRKIFDASPTFVHVLRAMESDGNGNILPALAGLMAKVNHAPPAPHELGEIWEAARRDWGQALATGKAAAFLPPDVPRSRRILEAEPSLFQGVMAKTWAYDDPKDAADQLTPDSDRGDETALLGPLTGFQRFVKSHLKYYTARSRLSKLLGRELPDERDPNVNLSEATPTESPYLLNVLSSVLPGLADAEKVASDAAAASAISTTYRQEELDKLNPFQRHAVLLAETGGAAGVATRTVGRAMEWIDSASFHLLSGAIHTANSTLSVGGAWDWMKSRIARAALSGTPSGADAETEWAYYLSNFGDAPTNEQLEMAGKLFTAQKLGRELPARISQLTSGWVNIADIVGATDEGVRTAIGELTSYFEEPATAILSIGVIPGAFRFAKEFKAKRAAARIDSAFSRLDKANLHEISASVRADLFSDLFKRIADNAPNKLEAQSMLQRVVETCNRTGTGLTPEIAGAMQTLWARLEHNILETRDAYLPPHLRHAIGDLAKSFTPETFFASSFVKSPEGAIVLNPLAPKNIATAARQYIDATNRAYDTVAVDPRLSGPLLSTLARAAEAAVNENARIRDTVARASSATRTLKLVAEETGNVRANYAKVVDRLTSQRQLEVGEHNTLIGQAIDTAFRLEHEGGTIYEPNPAINTPLARTAEAASTPSGAKALMFTKSGALNKRALQSLGGPDLLREVQTILSDGKKLGGAGELAKLAEARQLVQEIATGVLTESRTPLARHVGASPAPRSAALTDLQRRFTEAPTDQPFTLTNAELDIVNQYRSARAPLRPRITERLRALDDELAYNTRRLAEETELRDTATRLADDLDRADPTDLRAFNKTLTGALHRRFLRHMESRPDVYSPGPRAGRLTVSINRPTEAVSALESWRELKRNLTEEEKLVRREVLKETSFAITSLPPALQAAYTLDTVAAEAAKRNRVFRDAAAVSYALNRTIPDAQRILIRQSIREGRVHPALPKDAAEYVIGEMQRQREARLRWRYNAEMLSGTKLREFSRETYYHDTYAPDPSLASEVQRSALRDLRPSSALRVLEVEGKEFMLKRPEDSFWVAYSENGHPRIKSGFRNAAEAEAWGTRNLPEDAAWDVRPPVTTQQKISEGLILDPAHAHGKLMQDMVLDESQYLFQRSLAQTGLTRTTAELQALGTDPAIIRSGRALLPDGTDLFLVRDPTLPHINGKWVPTKLLLSAADMMSGHRLWSGIMEGFEDLLAEAQGKEISLLNKIGRNIVGTVNNLLGVTHVPFNPLSYIRGWLGNTTYSYLAGFNLVNPIHAGYFAKYMAELAVEMGPALTYRPGKTTTLEALLLSPKVSLETRELLEAGMLPGADTLLTREMADASRRFHTSVEGIHRRLLANQAERLRLTEAGASPSAIAEVARREARAQNALQEATSQGLKTFVKDFGRGALDAIRGKGEFVRHSWSAYVMGSGDVPLKIAAYKFLRRVKNLPKEEALSRINDFFQQIHNPQKVAGINAQAVAQKLGGTVGGSQFLSFKTEQLRILQNAITRRPLESLAYLGALASWNMARIAGSGHSPEDFFVGFAKDHGVQDTPFTRLKALLSGAIVNSNSDGSFYQITTDNLLGLFMGNPYTAFGKSIESLVAGRTTSPFRRTLAELTGGSAEAFVGANALLSMLSTLVSGKTAFGDPLRADTLPRIAASYVTPPLLGGSDSVRLGKVIAGTDYDPSTYDKKGPGRFAAERLLGLRRIQGTAARFRAAINYTLHERFNVEDSWSLERRETNEENKFYQVASGAIDPRTGRLDPEKHAAIALRIASDRNENVLGSGGELLPTDSVAARAKAIRDDTSMPHLLYRFKRIALPQQIAAYASWREGDREPTGDWDRRAATLISNKIASGRHSRETLRTVYSLIHSYTNNPNFPADARARLSIWGEQISRRRSTK